MSTEYRRLYRSRKERMLMGVCGGLGEYFRIDPTLVRLAFVIATLLGGPGLIAYIVLMIVVPEESEQIVEAAAVDVESAEEEPVVDAKPDEETPEA
ncbi:MAG: PspC domain-containing protein [Anaerolineales bacterium]|nr:PspC domain-containing protein [Anaerolineales bacterium]